MKRRIQIVNDDPQQEPMLPLINIVFLLLIFFMIAGSLQKLGPFDVDPPDSATATAQAPDTLVIWVAQSGEIGVDETQGRIEDIASLLPNDYAGRPVEIRADRGVEGTRMVGLLKRLQALGLDKVHLMTAVEPEE